MKIKINQVAGELFSPRIPTYSHLFPLVFLVPPERKIMTDAAFRGQAKKWVARSRGGLGPIRSPYQLAPTGAFQGNPLVDVMNFTRPKFTESFARGMGSSFGMVFNTRMRGLIAQMIEKWMADQKVLWDFTKPSVAIQLRRGDRVLGATMEQLDVLCAKWKNNRGIVILLLVVLLTRPPHYRPDVLGRLLPRSRLRLSSRNMVARLDAREVPQTCTRAF